MEEYEYVLVGAGFFCSVIAERIANDLGKRVLILEKRTHIGGNSYSETEPKSGIEYHSYGTHIFHTSKERVWKYMEQFTSFNSYYHQVLTSYKGKVYQMPINLETINSFYGVNLRPYEVDDFLAPEKAQEHYGNPQNFEEEAINQLGRSLYEAFIKGYTTKQWGRSPKELPASIIKRLPFRKNYSESYYFDRFQGLPKEGYGKLFRKLLDSDKIEVRLNTDFFDVQDQFDSRTKIIYSGPIDRLLNYKYGSLEYRSLRFEFELQEVEDFQGTSVMNYAEESIPYTRIHEPKHLHPERNYSKAKTLIIKEYAQESNSKDPYYPIGGEKNRVLYQKYLRELEKKKPNILIGGRLGDYKYYDMHEVIEKALDIYYLKIKKHG